MREKNTYRYIICGKCGKRWNIARGQDTKTGMSALIAYTKGRRNVDMRKEAERLGLGSADSDTWDDVFNRIFLTYVETSIPTDRQVYITDYPKGIRCLAKAYEDRPCRKRWEMYINGIEVANCYDEETDKEETRSYFREEEARLAEERRGTGDAIPPTDPAFPDLDIPSSSGVAMGLDRLLAAELGMKSIEPLLLFPLSDMLNAGKSR